MLGIGFFDHSAWAGDVERKDTDQSEGKDTGSSQKERFSLFFLSRDFYRVLGLGVWLGLSWG